MTVTEEPFPGLAHEISFGLRRTRRLQRWCLAIACSPWLDLISILIILMSCAWETTYNPCTGDHFSQEVFDAFELVYFILEIIIKMVALGVFRHEGSYLKNNWHKFNVIICCGEFLYLLLASFGLHFPIIQIMKPMRLLSRVPSLRILLSKILHNLFAIVDILLLFMSINIIFGIMGVQLWAGELRHRCFLGEDVSAKYNVSLTPYFYSMPEGRVTFICSPDGRSGMLGCSDVPPYREGSKVCSLPAPEHPPASAAHWTDTAATGASVDGCVNWNLFYNVCRPDGPNPELGAVSFDNIGYACSAIFQVTTLQGWTVIMYYLMDTYSLWCFLFFIPVTILGSFVVINTCAVIIASLFSETSRRVLILQHAGAEPTEILCSQLLRWLHRLRARLYEKERDSRRQKEENAFGVRSYFQRGLEELVKGEVFSKVLTATILANTILLVVEHHNQPPAMTETLKICSIILTILFVVEMLLKLLAFRGAYFTDRGNIYDFVTVIISLWEIGSADQSGESFLAVSRMLRTVRLIFLFPVLKNKLTMLTRSMNEATTFCFLLFLFIFVFSILGMHLFGCTPGLQLEGESIIDDRKNFDSLLWSMVTVFQILTEEGWYLALYNTMASTTPWSAVYFIAVMVFGKYILLNLVMGIIIESYHTEGSASSIEGDQEVARADTVEEGCEEAPGSTDANLEVLDVSAQGPKTWIQTVQQWCKDHDDWSLFLLSPQNRCRIFCSEVISHRGFISVIVLFIMMSCVIIALERPTIQPDSMERLILERAYFVFTAVFTVEMVLKICALGLILNKGSYCRSSWNILDGLLVVISLADIFVMVSINESSDQLDLLKTLQLLKVLRPLRMVKRIPRLALALEALGASVRPMGNIILICFTFFFAYGIVGVQLFRGKFYHCVGQDLTSIVNKSDCLSANHHWTQKKYNFDNLLQALMSLFIMYSKNGWVTLMYDGIDAVGVDQQPIKNHNVSMVIFFISFMFMSFFMFYLFIGVMVHTYRDCQRRQSQHPPVGEPSRVPAVANDELTPIKRQIRKLSRSKILTQLFTAMILISILLMAVEHRRQLIIIHKLTDYLFYFFTIILIMEVMLKLLGFGVVAFIEDRWNLLDVVVIFVSLISILLPVLELTSIIPFDPIILRLCRMLRVVQVLKAGNIRVLLGTIARTLSQVSNICLLFLFFLFICAAMGVKLFGEIECSFENPCEGLHRHSNFQNSLLALLTLYKVFTGDNWGGILKDTLRECRPDDGGCFSYPYWLSPIFFTSFVIVAQFVLANLVVAVIMQVLDDIREVQVQEQK